MALHFTKMHGCGNDYVYINCFTEQVNNPVALAQQVSNRNFGIGSDGLILIKPIEGADAEMVMYNVDGSISEMCGNGLRCVAKYVYDHGIAPKEQLTLMTGDGLKKATISNIKEGTASQITIDMGAPTLNGPDIPTTWNTPTVIEQLLKAGDREFSVTCVSMGNPHCVIYVDDVAHFPIETYGPLIEQSSYFPKRVNVEFVEIISPTEVIQRTWERGCGETLACGTGASAVCVAGQLTGKTQEELLIHLSGGDLQLSYSKGKSVIMTGPAVEIFSGVL
ncbi:MAG: diaminopimelate epimerase [Fibrobacterales bacterium]